MKPEQEIVNLPRWVYLALSITTAAIGVAACGVTAQFFVLGLERLEPDPMARSILVATGMLMIATEMACFGVAALLPPKKMRLMRIKLIATGLLLLAFEAATIYATQGALDQASETAAQATNKRVEELQASIGARRAAAQSLRANGTQQSASSNSWTRSLGAAALRDALKVESEIEPLAREIAQLQAAVKPTTASVLGEQGVMAYGLARGLLISTMGLVMFGAAGALLREALARNTATAVRETVSMAMPLTESKSTSASSVALEVGVVSTAPTSAVLGSSAAPGRRKDGWRKALRMPGRMLGTPAAASPAHLPGVTPAAVAPV